MRHVATNMIRILIVILWGVLVHGPGLAQEPTTSTELSAVPGQLIVLLAHGDDVPTPEGVIESHRQGLALPANLGVGSPEKVEFAISHRPNVEVRQALEQDPNSPRARLGRFLLFTYPEGVNLSAIQQALEKNPHVENVERNLLFDFHVSPNDPFFDGASQPPDFQWGSEALNLPAAWDLVKGHAFVGLIDTGVELDHPDLAAFDALGNFLGGNIRPHLSFDFGDNDADVNENPKHGHGTHVSGIVGATANNGLGVAGACWNCSVLMSKGIKPNTSTVSDGLTWLVNHGVQAVSMSFGAPDIACPNEPNRYGLSCTALAFAEERDVLLTASPGNDKADIEFPASDGRVMSIGGLEATGQFWDRADEGSGDRIGCPCDWANRPSGWDKLCATTPTLECGSNYTKTPGSAQQDLVAPAKEVLSTFLRNGLWNEFLGCWDDPNHAGVGYDVCTGTSMSSPYGAGLAALLRSIDPLLTKSQVREALINNANRADADIPDPKFGYGVPDAAASARSFLGTVTGQVSNNRLTPLFSLQSFVAETHFYTTAPQMASAAIKDPEVFFTTTGPEVSHYTFFPGARCVIGPCVEIPKASVFIFTTDNPPFPGAPDLVPLYRMSFDDVWQDNSANRSFFYTTEAAGLERLRDVGYRFDGIEGYIYPRCTPEPSCIPPGAVRLYRLYNLDMDDYAIFPETELAEFQAAGYVGQSGLNDWIGYVYLNEDTDGDDLVDGFERVLGTDLASIDSDCDGLSDGTEVLGYPRSDPRDGTCSGPEVMGEVGRIADLTHVEQTVVLSRSYSNPVVLAQPLSFNGGHQSVVRITSVQPDRFTFFIDEAPNQDGPHTLENVSYVVLEAGRWQLADGRLLEVDKTATAANVGRTVTNSWQSVPLTASFSSAPVVFTQVQTSNDPAWVKTRQLASSTTSFRMALEEDEGGATSPHAQETVGWFAFQPGQGTWSGHDYQVGRTSNAVAHNWINFPLGITVSDASELRFLASLATYDGPHPAGLRYRNLTASGVEVKVEEDTVFDTETGHTTEEVSFLFLYRSGQLSATRQ